MAKCKHNRLPIRVKIGDLPRDNTQYYCTQCASWVPAGPINQSVDKLIREDIERMAKYRSAKKCS